uniref:Cilia- and flagella-associated protein 61 N-terminal domain-containing protein n=1 Tax=Timema genevievae TaxID=629358 RepID=A0A7R9K266_TIMGE|nr:unnamed protein product [Timema genevievae]
MGLDIFDEYFTHLLPLGGKDFSRIQTILLCVRQRYLKKMKIRHAREEDHDDLMPLFDRSACRLREHYGQFFISELISTADEKRHIMVAEVRNRVVGMLSLSSNVNYTLLNHHFELVPFYGLRQPDERDKITLPAVARTDSQESLHFTESELTIYSLRLCPIQPDTSLTEHAQH